MRNKLIEDINNYIAYLNSTGLYVSVHGKTIGGLLEHNVHKNPFCAFVKTNDAVWGKCVKCQQKLFYKNNTEYFFGMCHAGVEEYVFFADDKTFVSVSGYGVNHEKATERINRLSHEYHFERSELLTVYEQGLKHEPEDIHKLKVLIKPLCHMLSLLQVTIGEFSELQSKNKTFDSILAYVQRNFMHDITLRSIVDACACSASTVSHLFKEYTNQSVKKYINELRIRQAEKLLLTTNLPISNVASLCGFADTNYFSTAFKKKYGVSPSTFRADNRL
ncbi:MAG: helix-turn-helix transcriptional regulator [Clostridia bacterium]|nr:helix-turn-helix transcriptional regulator [Clostridia bacterium]